MLDNTASSSKLSSPKGRAAKERGINRAAASAFRRALLATVRAHLQSLCEAEPGRTVCADDAQAYLASIGAPPTLLGMAAGALFRCEGWCKVGFRQTARVSSHARPIWEWTWAESE